MNKEIFLKATLNIYSKAIITVLQFFGLIFVAKLMGPEPIGMIGYATGFVSLFAIVGNLGFSTTHRKKISEGNLDSEKER